MSKILMTGGTGFIGSYILKNLIKDISISQIILTTRNKNKAKKILQSKEIYSKKVKIIEFDFARTEEIQKDETKEILNSDTIIHIGGSISLSNSKKIIDINYEGTKFLLDLFHKNKITLKKFIFFSTAYAFGIRNEKVPENWILEKPANFRNNYEESKFKCEKLIFDYNKKFNLNYVIIRPSIVISKKFNSYENPQTIFLFGKYLQKHKNIDLYSSYQSQLNFISLEKLKEIFQSGLLLNRAIINAVGENVLVSDLKFFYEDLLNVDINLVEGEKGLSSDNSINSSMPYLLNPQIEWETTFIQKNNLEEKNLDIKKIMEKYFEDE